MDLEEPSDDSPTKSDEIASSGEKMGQFVDQDQQIINTTIICADSNPNPQPKPDPEQINQEQDVQQATETDIKSYYPETDSNNFIEELLFREKQLLAISQHMAEKLEGLDDEKGKDTPESESDLLAINHYSIHQDERGMWNKICDLKTELRCLDLSHHDQEEIQVPIHRREEENDNKHRNENTRELPTREELNRQIEDSVEQIALLEDLRRLKLQKSSLNAAIIAKEQQIAARVSTTTWIHDSTSLGVETEEYEEFEDARSDISTPVSDRSEFYPKPPGFFVEEWFIPPLPPPPRRQVPRSIGESIWRESEPEPELRPDPETDMNTDIDDTNINGNNNNNNDNYNKSFSKFNPNPNSTPILSQTTTTLIETTFGAYIPHLLTGILTSNPEIRTSLLNDLIKNETQADDGQLGRLEKPVVVDKEKLRKEICDMRKNILALEEDCSELEDLREELKEEEEFVIGGIGGFVDLGEEVELGEEGEQKWKESEQEKDEKKEKEAQKEKDKDENDTEDTNSSNLKLEESSRPKTPEIPESPKKREKSEKKPKKAEKTLKKKSSTVSDITTSTQQMFLQFEKESKEMAEKILKRKDKNHGHGHGHKSSHSRSRKCKSNGNGNGSRNGRSSRSSAAFSVLTVMNGNRGRVGVGDRNGCAASGNDNDGDDEDEVVEEEAALLHEFSRLL